MPHQSRIEPDMDQAVASIGGRRTDEVYKPAHGEKNADYIFESDRVVMELKSLETDQFKDIVANLDLLIREWISTGHLPRPKPGYNVYETSALPEREQLRVIRQVTERVRTVIKEANRQIKKTKQRAGMPDAKGVLMLVNDGNTAIEPELMHFVLARAFHLDDSGNRRFSGIDRLIYLTYDMPGVSMMGPQTQIWSTPMIDEGDASLTPFLQRVRDAWFSHIERNTGSPMPTFALEAEAVRHIRYRDEAVPLNRSSNDLMANSFRFGEGTEQELIDALGPMVQRLRESDFDMAEMMRMLITPTPEWDPNAMFPAFQRFCRGFKVRSAVATYSLDNWPGQTLLSVHICKADAREGYDSSRVMPNDAIPFIAEIALIERLPETLKRLDVSPEVELCQMNVGAGESPNLNHYIPGVWYLCKEQNVALLAEERSEGTERTFTILMRRTYL